MSSKTAAGRSASKEARAPATVPASTVSYSHPRSASLSVQRIIDSSSTTKIFSFAIASLTFCDSTFAEQLLCQKPHVDPPSQKRAANGHFRPREWDFSAIAAESSISKTRAAALQLFGFDW